MRQSPNGNRALAKLIRNPIFQNCDKSLFVIPTFHKEFYDDAEKYFVIKRVQRIPT